MPDPMRLHVIACPVFQQELALLAEKTSTALSIRHLEAAVHERPASDLHQALQHAIDETRPEECDAVVVAYGLCNRGVIGLRAGAVPVVIPRAHDCIGMLLGSSRRYLDQVQRRPGTYFQSPGWLANAPGPDERRPFNMTFGPGSNVTRDQLARQYGEENADYLFEQFAGFTAHYDRLAFIETPVSDRAKWEAAARQAAARQGWRFEKLTADLGWLRRLLQGEWDESEFLVLRPGQRVVAHTDERLIGTDSA